MDSSAVVCPGAFVVYAIVTAPAAHAERTLLSGTYASETDAITDVARWCINQYEAPGGTEWVKGTQFDGTWDDAGAGWLSDKTPDHVVEMFFRINSVEVYTNKRLLVPISVWAGAEEVSEERLWWLHDENWWQTTPGEQPTREKAQSPETADVFAVAAALGAPLPATAGSCSYTITVTTYDEEGVGLVRMSRTYASEEEAYTDVARWCLNKMQNDDWALLDDFLYADEVDGNADDDVLVGVRAWIASKTPRDVVEFFFGHASAVFSCDRHAVPVIPEWNPAQEIREISARVR